MTKKAAKRDPGNEVGLPSGLPIRLGGCSNSCSNLMVFFELLYDNCF